ncbi:DUF397 domain-containing protein [Salinactinospora qingdaonensis]|uniref:DUF397 domain-containing protein n=1 Tax=Salinactinospora qingdaonensis TaxID=702744 RepID=A0ABP7FWY2_9ACTN
MNNTLQFRKSSYSSLPDGCACVEVADTDGTSAVRDSTRISDGHLPFSSAEWAAFVHAVKSEEL